MSNVRTQYKAGQYGNTGRGVCLKLCPLYVLYRYAHCGDLWLGQCELAQQRPQTDRQTDRRTERKERTVLFPWRHATVTAVINKTVMS